MTAEDISNDSPDSLGFSGVGVQFGGKTDNNGGKSHYGLNPFNQMVPCLIHNGGKETNSIKV